MVRKLMLFISLAVMASGAVAQSASFNPAAEYVTPGQDEPGYRRWVAQAFFRPMYVRAFNNYLISNGVGGVAPTWQLLRTASQWERCAAEPFEVPPTSEWANIVATLRFIGDSVVPVIGSVEPVSVYRNPSLNVCAGGAQASTHREMGAVDVVPLRPTSRGALMINLCEVHLRYADRSIGLGFYKGLRFHIDSRKFREWGTASSRGAYGCQAVLAEAGRPFLAPPPPRPTPAVQPSADPLVTTPPLARTPVEERPNASSPPVTAPASDPLAPVVPPVPTDSLAPR